LCDRRSSLDMVHFARCIQNLSRTKTLLLFPRRFLASSKKPRHDSERRSSLVSSTTSPPVLIDAFIKRAQSRQHEISDSLSRQGWACIDNFMGADACAAMRAEATKLMKVNSLINLVLVCYSGLIHLSFALQSNAMKISKSSRWDADAASHVPYDKHNVLSTEMTGGEM
jgi:hypothetical protein